MITYNKDKLVVDSISHFFEDNKQILKDINISVKDKETISILGVSGVGKTTLFNIIAGLISPSKGKILLNGKDITSKKAQISYMLQKDLLLPFRTVYENIALPLEIKGEDKHIIKEKIMSLVKDFGLEDILNSYPISISGGQRQRVALLRTYMFSSEVVLLDEPFSALDYFTKRGIYKWFNDLKKKLSLTSLIITHDIDEAMLLSDKIYIIKNRPGTITNIIELPKNKDLLSKEFIELKQKILKILIEE